MADQKGLFGRLREAIRPAADQEKRYHDPAFYYPWTPTQSGVAMSREGAMAVSAVYACVNKISSTIASLDLHLYRMQNDRKEGVYDHPAFVLCDSEPNAYYNAFTFWQFIISDALMHGAGYALIKRDQNGRPKELVLTSPNSIVSKDLNGRRIYMYEDTEEPLYNEDVLAIECFRGVSPIAEHIENISLGYAAQQYGASFFGSGGNMSGVLMTDKQLSEDQYRRLSSTWQQKYHGMNSSHATAILEAGLKYERVGIPPDQSQFLGVRKYQVEEVCRIFNVPTGMVQVGEQKYSNVEQQDLFFAKHTIHPWLVSIEQEMNRKLLLPEERKEHKFKFDMLSLMRGDMAARSQYYHTLLSDGVLTINEVRGLENRNAIEGGDQALVQVNQLPLTSMEAYANSITSNNGDVQ
jgi:HK97 family phage portal protein